MHPALSELELPQPRCSALLGTWHIVRTNFPMWLEAHHCSPRFEYGAIANEDTRMRDCVHYRRKGKAKTILGIDTQDPALPCHFTWRGSGLLRPLRSEWYVIDMDDVEHPQLVALLFTKTLFTPAGMDIITRAPDPDPALIEACLARLDAAPSLRVKGGVLDLQVIEQAELA